MDAVENISKKQIQNQLNTIHKPHKKKMELDDNKAKRKNNPGIDFQRDSFKEIVKWNHQLL
jgi:hypothetical protein